MKKYILTALLIFAIGLTSAQNTQFGIKGGLNLANQYGTGLVELLNTSPIIRFHLGGFVEMKLSDKISIQPELLYSLQGCKSSDEIRQNYDPNEPIRNSDFFFNLSYINIPVLFKYYIIEKFSLEAGPQIGVLINSKVKQTLTGQPSIVYNNISSYNSLDYGLNIGAGYDISEKISTGIRYNIGLCDIDKSTSVTKNRVFSLSMCYKL
ncbi:porin family protein [Flavobacterium sp.]|jgi:hypothetical protein|uniref:porin family protein n=1 Tax=Flavobacterium sp. TaxID=239 RepID=UPI0037BE3E35